MKKILPLLLAVILCLSICACGDEAGHTCSGAEWVAEKDATCLEDGVKQHLCSCGKSVATAAIPAYGHSFEDGVCSRCGEADANIPSGPSEGLQFASQGDGTCYVSGIGTCTDTVVVIPSTAPNRDRVTKIGGSAFERCSSITEVVIPSTVTEIGAGALMDCSSLKSLDIPASVTKIGGSMIYGCHSLTVLTIRSATVLGYPEPPMHAEDNTSERMSAVYVPAELVEEYRDTYGWRPFGEKIQAITE